MTRWIVRIVMLAIGAVFFLSLLAVACVLASVWGLRMLWAKLTGQPVIPWVMPMRAASSWASMYQRSGGFGGGMASAATATHTAQDNAAPFTPAAGTKRGGILSTVAAEVSDVQPREVHDR